jgi:hypothetical protein
MSRESRPLRLYGTVSDRGPLEWQWVKQQLREAGTYWVVVRSSGAPHPRPVWGVWQDQVLHLSIGSPTLRSALLADPLTTVHLDSGTDVVIVEGLAAMTDPIAPAAVAAYDGKYDWTYQVEEYGLFTVVRPLKILAWRSAGRDGRDGFQQTGCWHFDGTPPT